MAKTMSAAFVRAPYKVQLREVLIPAVREDWVLLKVKACGICGSDLLTAGTQAKDWQPFGHEIAGVVAQVGPHVTTVKEGDKVALESASFCGHCEACRNGRVDLCRNAPNFWGNETRGFAEYMLAPKQALAPFDGLDFEVASLAEPLGVAVDMVYTAGIGLGQDVLVMGLGPIGLMSIPLARLQGAARIYAVNRSGGKRVEAAKAYGADEVHLTTARPLTQIPFRHGGVDRALVSSVPRTFPDVMKVMNYGGVISYIGIEYGEGATIGFDANAFHFKKLQLRASFASPALYLPLCLQLMKDGHVDGRTVISHVMPLEQIEQALLLLRDDRENAMKIVITP